MTAIPEPSWTCRICEVCLHRLVVKAGIAHICDRRIVKTTRRFDTTLARSGLVFSVIDLSQWEGAGWCFV